MSTETKLPFDKEYVSSFSKEMGEPAWLTELRLNALANAENLPMPKPDKTKIDKWNFTQFNKHIFWVKGIWIYLYKDSQSNGNRV